LKHSKKKLHDLVKKYDRSVLRNQSKCQKWNEC